MEIVVPFALLLVLMLSGLPIAFAMGLSGLVGIWMTTDSVDVAYAFMGMVPTDHVTGFTLLALPMFLLLAYLASVSGMAEDTYTAVGAWLSGVRGGLPMATLVAGGAIGALSGSSLAAASALSEVSVRNQVRLGYSQVLSSGVAALSSTLAVLIPPSILMIVYGIQTQTSIGDLLIAGLLPGVLLLVLLALTIRIWVAVQPSAAPQPFSTPWRERISLTAKVWPIAFIMVGIFAALYSGVVTPTEVAGVGALATLAVAAMTGRVRWRELREAALRSVHATSMILLILICGTLFARYLAYSGLAQDVALAIRDAGLNRWIVILLIIVAYFVLSMFMDEVPLVVLSLPITFPIVTHLGFDPVWFGVVTMLMVIMGLVFPPVGLVGFVVGATAGVSSSTVFKGSAILLIPVFVTTALVVAVPDLALWLPQRR